MGFFVVREEPTAHSLFHPPQGAKPKASLPHAAVAAPEPRLRRLRPPRVTAHPDAVRHLDARQDW